MGYRSDVVLAFAFKEKAQIDEVLAVYRMHHRVQEYDLAKEWEVRNWDDTWGLTYSAEYVKWYEGYDDVNAFEHMLVLVETFAEERGEKFPFAYYKIRVGEELEDIVTEANGNDSELEGVLYDRMSVNRSIETSF